MICSQLQLFVLDVATFTIVCILHIESHFCIFCVLAFCPEKKQKIDSEIQIAIYVAKNSKMWSPGAYCGSKNAPELTSDRPKIVKV